MASAHTDRFGYQMQSNKSYISQKLLKYRNIWIFKISSKYINRALINDWKEKRDIISFHSFKPIYWVYFINKILKARI